MSNNFKIAAVLMWVAVVLPVLATPAGAPAKKVAAKHHAKMIPARHNAGRPIHP